MVSVEVELLSASQLAEMLGISERSVWRRDSAGHIPMAVNVGRSKRWRRREIIAWIAAACPPRHKWSWG